LVYRKLQCSAGGIAIGFRACANLVFVLNPSRLVAAIDDNKAVEASTTLGKLGRGACGGFSIFPEVEKTVISSVSA
jgi:hypothetical protein